MSLKQDYNELVQTLKTERDDLNVRMHLAGAELRDEWHHLEESWEKLQQKSHHAGAVAGDSAEDVGAAIRLLGEELRAGYKRIRQSLH